MKMNKRIVAGYLAFCLTVSSTAVFAESANGLKMSKMEALPIEANQQAQLVVAVEKKDTMGIQTVTSTVTQHEEIFESLGIDLVDSMMRELADQEGRVSAQSQAIEIEHKEILQKMGYVYLVEYDKAKFKNAELAEKDIEKKLAGKGLKVKYIEPNYVVKALEANPSIHKDQKWHYDMIQAPKAWEMTKGSPSVKTAILDTGIDYNHQNLKQFVDLNLGKSFVGGDVMDRQGHGTHVAGTVAAYGSISGVMKSATLIPVKVLDDSGSGSTYGVQQGILYAAQIKADVINMSLGGGPYSQGVNDACEMAVKSGTVVVAATGNESQKSISYPAAYESVIAVGAVDSNKKRAYFSNYGKGTEIMAPGVDIYSSVPGGGYAKFSGTSMATPHVAGVVGLLRSANKQLSATEVRKILQKTAVNIGNSNEYGYGLVNTAAAVQMAGGSAVEPPLDTEVKLTAAVQMNKKDYTINEKATALVTVTDEKNLPVSGVDIRATLVYPSGLSITNVAKTVNGKAEVNFDEKTLLQVGSYVLNVTAQKSGSNHVANASTTLSVLEKAKDPVLDTVYSIEVKTALDSYIKGNQIKLYASVKDKNKIPPQTANVTFKVTRPNGTYYYAYGKTDRAGNTYVTLVTNTYSLLGTYKYMAMAEVADKKIQSQECTFELKDRVAENPKKVLLELTTSKLKYKKGETVRIKSLVTDEKGKSIIGAQIQTVITRPNGTKMTINSKTDTTGYVTLDIPSNQYTQMGVFKIQVIAKLDTVPTSVQKEIKIQFVRN